MASKRDTSAEEVAALCSVISLALRGGATVTAALEYSLQRASGQVAHYLQGVTRSIDLGMPFGRALNAASKRGGSLPVEELLNKLQMANELGSGLADQLDDLSATLRDQVSIEKLSRATSSETKMLLPLVFLILPVTVVFALYPSIQILNIPMEGI